VNGRISQGETGKLAPNSGPLESLVAVKWTNNASAFSGATPGWVFKAERKA
jgi:hypothetical protein